MSHPHIARLLDAELEANIHIARTQLAANSGLWEDAAAAAEAALERLRVLPAIRHASDAVRSWQLQVRLAQSVAGSAAPALALRGGIVALARAAQTDLQARSLVDPATRRESLWLAGQP